MRKSNTEFLKDCMANALIELLKEKPIDKISVTDITDKAGVGRATWFRNFSSKAEAISYKLISLWYEWCNATGIPKEQRYTIDNARDFFDFSLECKDLYNLIYSQNLQNTIYDAFYAVIIKQQRTTQEEYYQSRFLSYGVFGIVDEWVKRNYKEKPEEIANIINNTIIKKP